MQPDLTIKNAIRVVIQAARTDAGGLFTVLACNRTTGDVYPIQCNPDIWHDLTQHAAPVVDLLWYIDDTGRAAMDPRPTPSNVRRWSGMAAADYAELTESVDV